jgi:flagellar basal body-associated protein FliL
MPSKKVLVPLVVLVLGGAGLGYTTVAQPPAEAPEPKVHGEVYVLPKDFMVNLRGGRWAKVSVAFVLGEPPPVAHAAKGAAPAKPPDGYGVHPQEALARAIVTDELSGQRAARLLDADSREALRRRVKARLTQSTDFKVDEVIFTDVAVQ